MLTRTCAVCCWPHALSRVDAILAALSNDVLEDRDALATFLASAAATYEPTLEAAGRLRAQAGLPITLTLRLEAESLPLALATSVDLVLTNCGRLLLINYRGTAPWDLLNWLVDLDVGEQPVHEGFLRNYLCTSGAVDEAWRAAVAGEAMDPHLPAAAGPLEAVVVTGHSLGGALAQLLGTLGEPRRLPMVKHVVTFGQPMIGDAGFQTRLRTPLLRVVMPWDVVPLLPPFARFQHAGRCLLLAERQTPLAWWRLAVHGLRRLYYGDLAVLDHLPLRYLRRLERSGAKLKP